MEIHRYKYSRAWAIVTLCFAVVMAIDGLMLWVWGFGIWPVMDVFGAWVRPFCILVGFLGLGMVVFLLDAALWYEVVLTTDEVVVRSKLGIWNRRLARKDIAAKTVWRRLGNGYILYPGSKKQRKLTFGQLGKEDDYFRMWMESIPDADWRLFMRRLFR